MTERVVEKIGATRIVPVIRTSESGTARKAGEALIAGGAGVLEVALTCPDALEVIDGLAGKAVIGAASVLSVEMMEGAVQHGAAFTVSPHLDHALMVRAGMLRITHIPGAATPTEVVAAKKAGAGLIKVFPARELGGTAFLRALLGPLPEMKLIPAGGISPEQVGECFEAGAFAVTLGSNLVRGDALQSGDWDALTKAMRRLADELP